MPARPWRSQARRSRAQRATNVFSVGQETTVRLLGAALQIIGERLEIQQQLRNDRSLIPNFIEEALRIESPVKETSGCLAFPPPSAELTFPRATRAWPGE